MGEIFDYVDDLGPTKVIHLSEPAHGLKAVLVIDNVAAGPAIGGLRMAPDVSTRECARLARAMTLKNAAAGLPHGGGKSVILGDPATDKTEDRLEAFGEAVDNGLARAAVSRILRGRVRGLDNLADLLLGHAFGRQRTARQQQGR